MFSYDALDNAENTYLKLKNKVLSIEDNGEFQQDEFDNYNDKFKKYIGDDLNTANAITLIYDVLKSNLNGTTKLKLIDSFDKVLSLDLLKKCNNDSNLDEEILKQIEKRNIAKQEKNYELADSIRDELMKKGVKLIDSREGTTYEIVNKM